MPADAPATHHPARLRPGAVHLKVLTRGPGRSRKARDLVTDLVFALGGLLLVWSAAIHYHLWDDGYRSIATIGPLFLLQSIAGLVIGLGARSSCAASGRPWSGSASCSPPWAGS